MIIERNIFVSVVSKNIKKVREKKNITQEQLSQSTGLHITLISKYERGVVDPTAESIYKIAKALDIPLDYLFDYDIASDNNTVTDKEIQYLMKKVQEMDVFDRKVVKRIIDALYFKKDIP